jgi:dihydropteroate synthase
MEISIDEGIDIINDISGLMWDENSVKIVSKNNTPVIIMHSPWKPHEMQNKFSYPNGVMSDIISFFDNRITNLIKQGVERENIIIDPGIGFGKSIDDNFEIISNLACLKVFNLDILLGASNKSYIFNTIKDNDINKRIEGNAITEFIAYKSGVNILRVHDVASTIRTIRLSSKIKKNLSL